MRNHIHFFDRLRSYLTGRPATAYATRRLAREDLHALEEQRARAVARLTEDLELLDRYVNPLERYLDGGRLIAPLGTILDRRSGKNLPLVWTELDLREFRRLARVICDINPFAVGFLGLLTDFHLRQGFGWQIVKCGVRSAEFGVQEAAVHSEFRTPHSELQQILDEWKNNQHWGLKSREAFRRWRRDGEVFLRFFRGGTETRGLPVIRFVEPEQVGPPPGDDADGHWSFGIRTDPEDVEDVFSYFVRDPLGTGSEGDEVPADRILHLKANVDSSIKRGLPDFLPVQDDLERVRRILRNMGEVAAVQTAIAWVSQYATATADQVGTLIRAGSDYTRPKIGSPSGKLMDVVRYEPGTVLHMDDNRQFVTGPVGTGTPGFIQVEQAILRGCGARWRMPEYFSGDASNNNLASSIVAGSPFVVAVEGTQLEWAAFERAVAMKVLELCVESGRLSPADIAGIDVKAIPPAVALANREEEEKLRQMRHQAGVLSVTTWQQQVGLDPKHEAANFAAEAKQRATTPAEGAGKPVGESEEPCGYEDRVEEAWHLGGHGFTGELRDSLGRRRCYRDGKQVPCAELGLASVGAGETEKAKAGQDKDLVLKGVPRDPNCKDPAGPDATDWFAKDLLAHLKYRAEENDKLYKLFFNKFSGDEPGIGYNIAAALSFKRQAGYLMAPKWMDFGGPETGRGINTVVIAGHSLRKNQLGNIEFGFIADLFPTISKSIDSNIGYNKGTQYEHPYYKSNFGVFAEKYRADNLAAFGVGHGLARALQERMKWDEKKPPTLEQIDKATVEDMEAAIRAVFENEQALARRVNKYHELYGGGNKDRIHPKALFFIPEFGGFNTDSIRPLAGNKEYKGTTSIEAFDQLKQKAGLKEGGGLDDWLKKNRENYLDPHGLPPKG